MVARDDILKYLNELLRVESFSDYCVNGLQVEGKQLIESIAVGVSISNELFQSAIQLNADLIIVHHGLFWRGTRHPFALTGIMKNRVKRLLDHDINLAAFHLPLDAHPELGNNAQILHRIGGTQLVPFDVGFIGALPTEKSINMVKFELDALLPNPSHLFTRSSHAVQRVAVVSGGASHLVESATLAGADLFVTGEASEPIPRLIEELGIHFISAGHYNSERFGPMALGDHLKNIFDLPVSFIDIDNPI